MKSRVLAVIASLASMSCVAAVPTEFNNPIQQTVRIDTTGLEAIKVPEGIMYVTSNGRYVIQGTIVDTWAKKSLPTIDDISYSTQHIDLEALGFPLEKMVTFKLGTGPKTLSIFADPKCEFCKKFIADFKNHDKEYSLNVFLVPALGPESNRVAKSIFCSADASKRAELYTNSKAPVDIDLTKCDTKMYDLTLTMATAFNIRQVPFFISPSGKFKAGASDDFWTWAKQ